MIIRFRGALIGALVAFPAMAALAFPPETKPTAVPTRPVTAAALVGRWGDNGDCSKDVVFRGDGTFRSHTGGEGRWSLRGDRLVLSGGNGEFVMRVRWGGPNQLIITNPDDSVGTSQRC
jgi:hypothetical protein